MKNNLKISNVKPIEKLVLIDQIIVKIEDMISDNDLKPGDNLPSERFISEMLGVSRTSVRQALKALDFIGLIKISSGKSTFIDSSMQDMFISPFRFMRTIHNVELEEFFDIRRIMEVEIVKRVASNASKLDLKKMKTYLEESKKNINDVSKFLHYDFLFHMELSELSDNHILAAIILSLDKMLLLLGFLGMNYLKMKEREESYEQHIEIYNAMLEGDKEKASQAMMSHIDSIEKRMCKKK